MLKNTNLPVSNVVSESIGQGKFIQDIGQTYRFQDIRDKSYKNWEKLQRKHVRTTETRKIISKRLENSEKARVENNLRKVCIQNGNICIA